MATTTTRRGRPPGAKFVNEAPIAVRLPPAEKGRTQAHADREGRSLGNFVRMVYLRGLQSYEAEVASATKANA